MKIFTTKQISQADSATINNQRITSWKLMERAAKQCTEWLIKKYGGRDFLIFCGSGNNGGDGLAIARRLSEDGLTVTVFIEKDSARRSKDFDENLRRLGDFHEIKVKDFSEVNHAHFSENTVVIDAFFGIGLNKPLDGIIQATVDFLNSKKCTKVALDVPSGLFADVPTPNGSTVFQADETLTFYFWKRSFLHPETGKFCGKVTVLDINLDEKFIDQTETEFFTTEEKIIKKIYKPRSDFSNKGSYGKTCIVAGSFGKMGAAVMATKAAMRTGSGITFAAVPDCGIGILQISCPEAMAISIGKSFIENIEVPDDVTVAVGPGIGTEEMTAEAVLSFLKKARKPLVIDADALNILAKNPEYLHFIPKNSIITPHPKEFERLFGRAENSFVRLETARKKSEELGIFIVLKDHFTQICSPDGKVYYNLTGNSGMAKGGSGDALSGIISALISQNYSEQDAAIFGVWLHGKAGDFAAQKFSKEAMLPTDLIEEIGSVFKNFD